MKPLAIALSGVGRELREGKCGGNLTNVQCKAIQNCHNESPLYNEYILLKMGGKVGFLTVGVISVIISCPL
jgi:hypothetical protein